MTAYKSLLETTDNTRDLGGYLRTNGEQTKRLRLIRSCVPKYASKADAAFLRDNGIDTIIDLREDKSVEAGACSLSGMPGFRYIRCPITEGSGIPESPEMVPVSFLQIAESKGAADALHAIASAPAGVLFHCSAGKDRSGVLAAILLLLADVPEETVIADYMLTKEYAKGRLAMVRERFPDIDPRVFTPSEPHMRSFLALFFAKYGTVQEYLRRIGLQEAEIRHIREKLTEEEP